MDLIFIIPISLAVGLVVGVLSGLLGIGGGTIMVPAFRLIYGMEAIAATATSMLTIVPTSISGMISHIRHKTCVLGVGIAAGLGGACSSWFGVMLASWSPSWCIMLAAAVVIVYSATTMLKKALALPSAKAKAAQASGMSASGSSDASAVSGALDASTDEKRSDAPKKAKPEAASDASVSEFAMTKEVLVKSALIGLSAGVVSGYVGVGGGFIMVPLFLSKLNLPIKKASGTSLVAVGILVLPALITQLMLGNVDWAAGLACIVGSVPGATLGAKLQERMPERTLRFCFAGILGVAAVLLVVKEMGLLG